MSVVIATAMGYNSLENFEACCSWLENREQIQESMGRGQTRYFAACEIDLRGREPFMDSVVTDGLDDVWYYALDDNRTEITTENRLRHFVMGHNLCIEYALEHQSSLLLVGAGVTMPPNILTKLMETGHPAIGPLVPSYNLAQPSLVPTWVEALPAGCVLLDNQILSDGLRFRSHQNGLSDDWGLQFDIKERWGIDTMVRTDCIAEKWPKLVVPVADRGYGRRVFW